MALLAQNPWILLFIGLIFTVVGLRWVGLPLSDWIKFFFQWVPKAAESETQADKEKYNQPADEIVSASPGCFILLIGIALLVVGVLGLTR